MCSFSPIELGKFRDVRVDAEFPPGELRFRGCFHGMFRGDVRWYLRITGAVIPNRGFKGEETCGEKLWESSSKGNTS